MRNNLPKPCLRTLYAAKFETDPNIQLCLLRGIAAAYTDETKIAFEAVAAFGLAFVIGKGRTIQIAFSLMEDYLSNVDPMDVSNRTILTMIKPEILWKAYGSCDAKGKSQFGLLNIPDFLEEFVVPWSMGENMLIRKAQISGPT
jgi:hypothetical protein